MSIKQKAIHNNYSMSWKECHICEHFKMNQCAAGYYSLPTRFMDGRLFSHTQKLVTSTKYSSDLYTQYWLRWLSLPNDALKTKVIFFFVFLVQIQITDMAKTSAAQSFYEYLEQKIRDTYGTRVLQFWQNLRDTSTG